VCCAYYIELYFDVLLKLDTKKLIKEIMTTIPKKFTHSMNISLATPIIEG
jgi:hypothetical protein